LKIIIRGEPIIEAENAVPKNWEPTIERPIIGVPTLKPTTKSPTTESLKYRRRS
jgi:hypothetical protein